MDSPIEYPKIKIGGVEYVVRFDNATLYRLSKAHVNLKFEVTESREIWRYEQALDIGSAAIQRTPRFTPEELSEHFGPFAGESVQVLVDVLREAMGKVRPAAQVKLQEPAALPAKETPVQ